MLTNLERAASACVTELRDDTVALLDDYSAYCVRLILDRDHHRAMYRACFRAACDALGEVERQRRQIAELHDERTRLARTIFGRMPADE